MPITTIHSTQTDILCQQYLTSIYQNRQGHQVNARQMCNVAETYGEILYPSVNKLLSHLLLTDDDVFVDLGSGLGKVVLQVFLKTPVKESRGIEIVPELYECSLAAAQKVNRDLPDFYLKNRKLSFLYGNFLDISLNHATVILIGSPCFSPTTLLRLAKIIDDTPTIHSVLTLRPLPTLKRLRFKKALRIECSWDAALCYCYSR